MSLFYSARYLFIFSRSILSLINASLSALLGYRYGTNACIGSRSFSHTPSLLSPRFSLNLLIFISNHKTRHASRIPCYFTIFLFFCKYIATLPYISSSTCCKYHLLQPRDFSGFHICPEGLWKDSGQLHPFYLLSVC